MVSLSSSEFFRFLLAPGFFYRLWQALAGPGRPWQALAGHGRPWQAPAGLGRSEPIRTCTLGPSLPFPALDRASCGYSSHQGIGASGSVSFHSSLSVQRAPLVFDSFDSFLGSECSMKIRQLHMVNNQIPKEHIAIREWANQDYEHERIHWCTVDLQKAKRISNRE